MKIVDMTGEFLIAGAVMAIIALLFSIPISYFIIKPVSEWWGVIGLWLFLVMFIAEIIGFSRAINKNGGSNG